MVEQNFQLSFYLKNIRKTLRLDLHVTNTFKTNIFFVFQQVEGVGLREGHRCDQAIPEGHHDSRRGLEDSGGRFENGRQNCRNFGERVPGEGWSGLRGRKGKSD
jgi:hypothetical protein